MTVYKHLSTCHLQREMPYTRVDTFTGQHTKGKQVLYVYGIFMCEIGRVIHQSPDASNHRTPSKCRTKIPVIPTSRHLRLLRTESALAAASKALLLHRGFDYRALQAGHFIPVELAVFFPGSTKFKSIASVRACILAANPGE